MVVDSACLLLRRRLTMCPKHARQLDDSYHVGFQRYSVTTCTAFRRPVFSERWLVTDVTAQLLRSAALFAFSVPAYCVMPDHLHALVEAKSARADVDAFLKGFKQITGARYRQQTRDALWQPGHHERMLRDDEASDAAARYILENPVRAGLSNAVGDYPYAWSDVYDLERLFVDPPVQYGVAPAPSVQSQPPSSGSASTRPLCALSPVMSAWTSTSRCAP